VGRLDEDALARAVTGDPAEAFGVLAAMTHATDEGLRRRVRALAPRLVLDRVHGGTPVRRGVGRPRRVRASSGGDLDLDASLEAVTAARAEGLPPHLDDLTARDWGRPDLAVCLLVDASGSMQGPRLAAAAVTAAACALRTRGEHAVLAFARNAEVLKALTSAQPPVATVERVLRLRGHGVTALATALRRAADVLAGARARGRVVVLLSDCRATDGEDPLPAARALDELVVLAPGADDEPARALAAASGARIETWDRVIAAPGVLTDLLSPS